MDGESANEREDSNDDVSREVEIGERDERGTFEQQMHIEVFIRLRLSRSPYLPLYRRPQAIASNSVAGVTVTRGPLVALHLQHTSSPPVASLHLSSISSQHSQGEDQTVDHESTITLWLNNKFLKNKKRTCDIKRMSRLKMQEPHVTGTKSFARLAEEEATKNDDVASDSTNTQGTESEKDTSASSSTESQIVQQQNANPLIRTPKVPPSPIPTGNYNVSPEQLASMTRDHDMSALQNFDGVKGLSEMLKTNPDKGIDDDESNILDRKNVFGSNTYPRKKGRSFWRFLLDACRDTTLIILMVADAASLGLGIKTEGIKEGWYDGGSIALAVIIVIVVTAISDYKQSLQFQNLNEEKQNIHLEVVRGGRRIEISIFDIVVGDVIPLKIGDQVPADGVLISGHSLSIDESSMTGESKIVHKDHKNPFLMSGCKVADGYGTMLATSVGIHTEWGLLMASISEDNGEEKPLQVRLNGVATFIGIVGLVVAVSVLVILLVRFFTGHTEDDEGRIEFIAGLAYSMRKMMSDKALVSCIICSDKTGTLTLNMVPNNLSMVPNNSPLGNRRSSSESHHNNGNYFLPD
ncbi:hypothetical protein LXL04_011766 [Taraxacum kok-saghyz]